MTVVIVVVMLGAVAMFLLFHPRPERRTASTEPSESSDSSWSTVAPETADNHRPHSDGDSNRHATESSWGEHGASSSWSEAGESGGYDGGGDSGGSDGGGSSND